MLKTDQTYLPSIIKVLLNISEYIFVNPGFMNNKTTENTEHVQKLIPEETDRGDCKHFKTEDFRNREEKKVTLISAWILSWEQ